MAVGPSNKGSGKLKRTTIDPRRDNRPDAGFSGKAKPLSGFGKAFSVAYAKGPGTIFTFGGKKYKALRKHQGKGPSASRVEDKVSKADIMGNSKKNTTKRKVDTSKVLREDVRRKTRTNAAGQRMGQRKAGGMIKKMAYGGKVKKMMDGGMAMKDVPMDKKKSLGKLPTEVRNKMGFKKAGGMIKKKKKMAMGGMAMKYKHGGKVGKKCPRDGIAMKGKTRA